jgi:hypothetical protein
LRFDGHNKKERMEGKTRVVRKFLFMPKVFGTGDTRWLEFACVTEEYGYTYNGKYRWFWKEVGFTDELLKSEDGCCAVCSVRIKK